MYASFCVSLLPPLPPLGTMRSTPVYEADGFFNHATGPWYRGKRPHRSAANNNNNNNNNENNNIAGSSAAVGAGAPAPAPVVPDPAAHARAAKVFSLMTAQDPDATWIYQVG